MCATAEIPVGEHPFPAVESSGDDDGDLEALVASESVKRMCAAPSREQQLLVASLQRHYAQDLKRVLPTWTCYPDGPTQPAVDVAGTVGVPAAVLGAILAGRCRDQRIPATVDRQKRFVEWMYSHCSGESFVLNDSGVGPECAKGVVLALALNARFTSVDLSCNSLGDAGAESLARLLPEHRTLAHLDLSANSIGHQGVAALLQAMRVNSSVTSLDLSARPGRTRNRMARSSAAPLEGLLSGNSMLTKLQLAGTSLGPEGGCGLARGLAGNRTLRSLDLASNDVGPRGAVALAEVLGSCALEELNLSDNRIGDEGLLALAATLGSPLLGGEAASARSGSKMAAAASSLQRRGSNEAMKHSGKYQDSLGKLAGAMAQLDLSFLSIKDESTREASFEHTTDCVHQLAAAVEMAMAAVEVPKLKAVQLSNNGGSVASFVRVESLLQFNRVLERLSLDQSDHKGNENGWKSILTSLPINTSLKSLSLAQSRLGTVGVLDLAKALAFNLSLECLCLRGNPFGEEAARALGAVLATGCRALKQLHLGSCHLDDASGAAIAAGLVENSSLEGLNLRDNGLGEASGRGLSSALRGHSALLQLSLELNGIDLRWMGHIRKSLDRNLRLREKARPQRYRKRIDELVECQREVSTLAETLKRNKQLKKELHAAHEALQGELRDAQLEELARVSELEAQAEAVERERRTVEVEISSVVDQVRQVLSEGEDEASQLKLRIDYVDDRIRHFEKQMPRAKRQLDDFEAQAAEELTGLREELEKAEKASSSAEMLAAAAQRNLDSFASSVKAIREDVAGGDNPPRQRMMEVRPDAGKPTSRSGRKALASSPSAARRPATPSSSPRRPVTPGSSPRLQLTSGSPARRPVTPGTRGKASPKASRQ